MEDLQEMSLTRGRRRFLRNSLLSYQPDFADWR